MMRHALRRPHSQRRADRRVLAATFGYMHPFRDGNGHIQRLTFETRLWRKGVAMNANGSIHPAPYGAEMHRALAMRDGPRVAAPMTKFIAA